MSHMGVNNPICFYIYSFSCVLFMNYIYRSSSCLGLVLVIFCFSSYSVSGVGDEPGADSIATSSSIVAAVWRTSGGGDDGIGGGDDTGD